MEEEEEEADRDRRRKADDWERGGEGLDGQLCTTDVVFFCVQTRYLRAFLSPDVRPVFLVSHTTCSPTLLSARAAFALRCLSPWSVSRTALRTLSPCFQSSRFSLAVESSFCLDPSRSQGMYRASQYHPRSLSACRPGQATPRSRTHTACRLSHSSRPRGAQQIRTLAASHSAHDILLHTARHTRDSAQHALATPGDLSMRLRPPVTLFCLSLFQSRGGEETPPCPTPAALVLHPRSQGPTQCCTQAHAVHASR